jgi:hypothetical protein
MIALLRRLLGSGPREPQAPAEARPDRAEAETRLDAARKRLKATIPPPEEP